MDLLALLNGLIVQLNELQLKLADAQAAFEAEKQASYNLGLADGVAQKQSEVDAKQAELDAVKLELEELKKNPIDGSDKIYSQVELDAKLAEREVEVKAAAKVELKAELLAKYKEQQALESQGEAEIEALLS